jgi:hypothetical protein
MAKRSQPDDTAVPRHGETDVAEHDRIRRSNDHDQELERRGERSPHNEGYDEAADGADDAEITRVTEE